MGHEHIREIRDTKNLDMQLPLFRPYEEEVLKHIKDIDLNMLSPLDALNLLAEFKEKL